MIYKVGKVVTWLLVLVSGYGVFTFNVYLLLFSASLLFGMNTYILLVSGHGLAKQRVHDLEHEMKLEGIATRMAKTDFFKFQMGDSYKESIDFLMPELEYKELVEVCGLVPDSVFEAMKKNHDKLNDKRFTLKEYIGYTMLLGLHTAFKVMDN